MNKMMGKDVPPGRSRHIKRVMFRNPPCFIFAKKYLLFTGTGFYGTSLVTAGALQPKGTKGLWKFFITAHTIRVENSCLFSKKEH
jgi:hypothetical protein